MRLLIVSAIIGLLLLTGCTSYFNNPEAEAKYKQEIKPLSDGEVMKLTYLEETESNVALTGQALAYKKARKKYDTIVPSRKKLSKTKRVVILKNELKARSLEPISIKREPKKITPSKTSEKQKKKPDCFCKINPKTTKLEGVFFGRLPFKGNFFNPRGEIVEEVVCKQSVGLVTENRNACKKGVLKDRFIYLCVNQDEFQITKSMYGGGCFTKDNI